MGGPPSRRVGTIRPMSLNVTQEQQSPRRTADWPSVSPDDSRWWEFPEATILPSKDPGAPEHRTELEERKIVGEEDEVERHRAVGRKGKERTIARSRRPHTAPRKGILRMGLQGNTASAMTTNEIRAVRQEFQKTGKLIRPEGSGRYRCLLT